MIILIEGPDGAGKSTLAKALADHFKAPLHHSGRPLTGQMLRDNMQHIIELSSHHDILIVDRAPWVSEFIYSKAMKRYQMLSNEELISYHQVPQVVVYCTADEYNITVGKEHKPQEYMDRLYESHERIVNEYDLFFKSSLSFPFLRYNYNSTPLKALIRKIEQCVDLSQ